MPPCCILVQTDQAACDHFCPPGPRWGAQVGVPGWMVASSQACLLGLALEGTV